jgi:hypothetical protein
MCVGFPSGFIPFSSITYVTAADSAGDHLVVGVPAPGALSFISANIPGPVFTNQTFCSQVQLAPQQFYPNVYVPTAGKALPLAPRTPRSSTRLQELSQLLDSRCSIMLDSQARG